MGELFPYQPPPPRIRQTNDKDMEMFFMKLAERRKSGEKPDMIRQLCLAMTNFLRVDDIILLIDDIAELVDIKQKQEEAPISFPCKEEEFDG